MFVRRTTAALAAVLLSGVSAQTFQRLGTCPKLGCVLPPDQQDFLPGQFFDLRFEVHAPVNGSEKYANGIPDEAFSATIAKENGTAKSIVSFFNTTEPKVEKWTFKWFEDLYMKDSNNATVVNAASKIYRRLVLYEPGKYKVVLKYYGNQTTEATWTVRPLAATKKVKNVILFIGKSLIP